MERRVWRKLAAAVMTVSALGVSAEPLPNQLAGSWKITRVLPTGNPGCWTVDQARSLVGSTLSYASDLLTWRGGNVPVEDISTRDLTAEQFRKENSAADFRQLGIRMGHVLEVDFQHADMDITGASTEIPGDSVLVAGGNRIVVSACGVFLEATRAGAGNSPHMALRR